MKSSIQDVFLFFVYPVLELQPPRRWLANNSQPWAFSTATVATVLNGQNGLASVDDLCHAAGTGRKMQVTPLPAIVNHGRGTIVVPRMELMRWARSRFNAFLWRDTWALTQNKENDNCLWKIITLIFEKNRINRNFLLYPMPQKVSSRSPEKLQNFTWKRGSVFRFFHFSVLTRENRKT